MDKFGSIEEKVIYEKLTKELSCSQELDKAMMPAINYDDGYIVNYDRLNSYMNEISKNIIEMENTRVNTAHRNISSHRKITGKFIVLGKKIVRKLLKWYIDPICNQQTRFNNAVVPTIGRLTEIQSELLSVIISLNKQLVDSEVNLKNRLEDQEVIFNKQLVDCEEAYQTLTQRLLEIESNNVILNSQIIEANNQLGKLNQLDLGIFKDKQIDISNKKTVSQAGEDAIVSYILETLKIKSEDCSYLDLGANHAQDLSNTYMLYNRGARGVLVEANPALIPELKFFRNEDVILNKCISEESNQTVDFYVLNGDGLSTLDLDSAKDCIQKNPSLEIERIVSVETITVNEVIEKYLGKAPTVLNIDIEGKELDVLYSIDFNNHRPLLIIIEMIPYKPTLVVGEKNVEILELMEMKGYMEYAFTGINSIFIDRDQLKEIHE